MKAIVLSLTLACVLACPRPAPADTLGAAQVALVVTPFVIQAVLDLQEAWNCYVEGFRKRHPAPRPVPPKPDSLPQPIVPAVTPEPSVIAPLEP